MGCFKGGLIVKCFGGNKQHNKPECPECGSENIAKILYGFPEYSKKLRKQLNNKEIILGGCQVYSDVENDRWHCNDCGQEFF